MGLAAESPFTFIFQDRLRRLASCRLPGSRVRSPHRRKVFRFLVVALLGLFTLPNLLMILAFARFDQKHLTGRRILRGLAA